MGVILCFSSGKVVRETSSNHSGIICSVTACIQVWTCKPFTTSTSAPKTYGLLTINSPLPDTGWPTGLYKHHIHSPHSREPIFNALTQAWPPHISRADNPQTNHQAKAEGEKKGRWGRIYALSPPQAGRFPKRIPTIFHDGWRDFWEYIGSRLTHTCVCVRRGLWKSAELC